MDYATKKLAKSEVEIKATVPEKTLEECRKKAADEISKSVDIKGFRAGHVPLHVLEKHVDPKMIEAHAQELAVQQTYAEAVVNEKLQIVARPKVKIESHDPLVFVAIVAVMPDVEIKDHKSIKVKLEVTKATDKEIDEVIGDMQKHTTAFKDVDRAAKMGDRAEVDFEGFDKGVSVENTKSSNHPVVLGENTLIPGFEDEIVGLKKDEKKEFDITFPKDYGKKDLQGKKLTFKVQVKRIEESEKPEVNEEFVEKVTGKKGTVASLKDEIRINLESKKNQEAKQKRENDYIEAVLKKMKVELPDALIEEESAFILQDMKEGIEAKGADWTEFLERAKTKEEDLIKKYKSEAERRIKVRLALRFLIDEEKIEVNAKDVEEELKKVKGMYPPDQHEKIQEEYDKGTLKDQLRNRLSLDKLFAKVLA